MVFIQHWLPGLLERVPLPYGSLGVQTFFVLSGFLITRILIGARDKATQIGAKRSGVMMAFYARRFLRIFPLYYMVVAIVLILNTHEARNVAVWLITYTLNIQISMNGQWQYALSHFWTLAVEEQFYLFWPLLILFVPRRMLLPMCVGFVVLGPLSRVLFSLAQPEGVVGVSTIENLDTLCAGACLGLLGIDNPSAKRLVQAGLYIGLPLFLVTAGHMIITDQPHGRHETAEEPIAFWVNHGQQLAVTFLSIYAVWRCAKGVPGVIGRVLLWGPLVYLGTISYGLYVIHNFVPFMWRDLGGQAGVPDALMWDQKWRLPFILVITIGLSALSWHAFEKPINALKKHFPYLPKQ